MTTITFLDQSGRQFKPEQLNFLAAEHPSRTIFREVLRYRTEGLTAQQLAEDISANPQTGEGGILHYASFATVSEDFSIIEVELAFSIDDLSADEVSDCYE